MRDDYSVSFPTQQLSPLLLLLLLLLCLFHAKPVTLVPHEGDAEIRNLNFGDDSVEIKSAEQHEAAAKAHATAEAMQ